MASEDGMGTRLFSGTKDTKHSLYQKTPDTSNVYNTTRSSESSRPFCPLSLSRPRPQLRRAHHYTPIRCFLHLALFDIDEVSCLSPQPRVLPTAKFVALVVCIALRTGSLQLDLVAALDPRLDEALCPAGKDSFAPYSAYVDIYDGDIPD
jgi:hypothetical protein